MNRTALYVLGAGAAYAVFLVATAPARLARPYWDRDLPDGLRVVQVHGTIWSGGFTLLAPAAAAPLSRVHFRFAIGPLMHGRFGYVVDLSGPVHGHLTAAFGSQTTALTDLAVSLPAARLAAFVPAAQDFGPGGVLTVRSPGLVWGPRPAGHGTLIWQDATLVSAPVNPLGTYVAHFVVATPAASYQIDTQEGRLVVRGRGRYRLTPGTLSFRGRVQAHGLRLQGLIQNIGSPDGHGGRRVVFRSPL